MSYATTRADAGAREARPHRARGWVPLLAAVLAACGGGSDNLADDAPAAVADSARTKTALADTTTWTRVAGEGQAFSVSGTQVVRFGADTRWVQKNVTTSGQCTNTFFGSDPAYGVVKSCEAGATVVTASDPAPWTTIATEGQSFATSGTQTVRYGADTRWVQKAVTGTAQCSNTFFGVDPAQWVVKSCQTQGAVAAAPTWTRIASEGQAFTVSGTQTVRYGAGSGWIQKSVTTSGTCSNGFFGSDPSWGVVKSCELLASAAPQPALVAPGTWSVIGSSTAAGVGATAGHGWVDLMRNDNAWRGVAVVNLGVGGSVTYNGLSLSAAVAGKPQPDTAHNVDAALAPGAKLVLINYPSNDVANGYTSDETVGNYLSMRDSAATKGAVAIALSTQPANWVPTPAWAATIADTDKRLAAAFGPCFVMTRTALALSNDTLNPAYDSGDGQHLNDAGHALVYSLVKAVLESGQCVKLAP